MAGWVPDQNSPPGFLTGFLGVVGPKLQEKHDQALKLQSQKKDAEFGTYWNSMQAAATRLSQLKQKGDLTPEELQEAQRLAGQYSWSEQQLNKMTKGDKPLGETFQKVGGFVKHLLSRPSPKGKLQPPGQQQPQTASAQAVDGSQSQATGQYPSKPLQPPAPIQQQQPSMQGAMALAASQSPEGIKRQESEEDRKRRTKTADELNLSGRDKAEYIETGKLPTQPALGNRRAERWKVGDKEIDVDYDPKTGIRYANGQEWEIPEGATRQAATQSAAMPRFGTQLIMLKDAKKLKGTGQTFNDPDGKPIDLDSIPEGMALQPLTIGGKVSFMPIDPRYQKYVVGNVAYAETPQQLPELARGGGTALGAQNVGTVTNREQAALDAQGNPIAQTLTTTRQPVVRGATGAPGVPGAPGTTPPAPASRQTPQPAPSAQPQPQPQAKPIGTPPPVPPPAANGRPLPGMASGTYNRMLDRITSVREGATQVFGDPSQPSMKSMKDFATMADDPQARQRVGKALLLTFNEMSKATGESGITGAAGPVSVHAGGGVIDLMEKYFGVPAAQAQQSNKIMQQAIQALTPEEREAYDATMSTFATLVGLRSLTRASASQASVGAIEREIPTIGLFTADSAQFQDRLQHLAEVVYNGSKGVPKGMWDQNPGLYDYIQNLPGKFAKPAANKPSPNGKQNPPATGTIHFKEGSKEWDIPAASVSDFRKYHPNAKEQ